MRGTLTDLLTFVAKIVFPIPGEALMFIVAPVL